MKLSEYIKELKKLEKEGHGDLDLIYTTDEEGNYFRFVGVMPAIAYANGAEDYWIKDVEFDSSKFNEPNVVCIN